jgi:hypothetical protein
MMTDAAGGTMTEPKIYKVPADNLARLQERIEKLNKRAAKLGVQPILLQIGEVIREEKQVTVRDEMGYPLKDEQTGEFLKETVVSIFYPIQVQGETPKYAGWTLVAALQFIEANGENEAAMFIRTVPGQSLPEEYRRIDQKCDHCQAIRRRLETFVVRHEDGTLKQVGRQCIADFLGHQDPERYAQIAEWVLSGSDIMGEAEDEGFGGGGGGGRTVWLGDFLGFVAMTMRSHGWLSRTKARELNQGGEGKSATADIAFMAMTEKPTKRNPHPPKPEEQDYELAKKAIEWLRTELAPKKELNDYQHNLVVICTRDVVVSKGFGVAASLIPTYKREMGFQVERKLRLENEAKSVHFGTVAKREVFELTVTKIIPSQSDFGSVSIHKMVDASGNIATWFSTGKELEAGKTYKITGTVKKHHEFRGIKQTVLTRCSVEGEWQCPNCRETNTPDSSDAKAACACGTVKGSWVCLNCRKVNGPEIKVCECGHNLKSWRCNKCYQYNVQKAKICVNKMEGPGDLTCGAPKNAWVCRAYGCGKANDRKTVVCSCGHDLSGIKVQG